MSKPEKPDNFLVYAEVGDPEHEEGKVTQQMIHDVAEMIENASKKDVLVFPWHTSLKVLPLEEPVDEIPVVPYSIEDEELKDYID